MKKTLTIVLFVLMMLSMHACGSHENGVQYTSGQCINCGVITERAIEYKNSIYCEDCYQNALPRICDICGGHADDGEIYNGIVYCGGCFDAYCDENDVHECANCGKFKKDCVNKKEEAGSIDVWICQDCNSDGKFTEDNTIEVQ